MQAARFLQTVNVGDVGMIQRGQETRLPREARQPLGVPRERSGKDFESNVAAQFGIAGAVDFAHPAFGEELHYRVGPKLAPDHHRSRTSFSLTRTRAFPGSSARRNPPPTAIPLPAVAHYCRHTLARETRRVHADRAPGRRGRAAQLVAIVPSAFESRFFSSRANQTFANCQSRITVMADTCSTSAVSSTLNPPKNRSSTTCACRGYSVARAWRASSRATRSCPRCGDAMTPSSIDVFLAPSPRSRFLILA